MEKEAVDLKKTGKKTGRIGLFVIAGMLAEVSLASKFPITSSLPPGTVTGAVASALYGAWDVAKRKWLK